MEHELAFSRIHIVEWLRREDPVTGAPDRRTGQETYCELKQILAETRLPIAVILHRVSSKKGFLDRLKTIENDFRLSGKVPLLQIETHGDDDGIGLSDDDGLTWHELMEAMKPLNEATGVRLVVFLAACYGMWGIRMAQPMDRSPFFAIMGPRREVQPGQVVRGLRTFYRRVLVERDGKTALDAMNNIVDPDEPMFRIFNCEQLFRNVWDWYLEDSSTEEGIAPRIEQAVVAAEAKRPRSPAEIEHLRAYMRNFILDYPARFEESRRHFFLIDRFPGNDARFNLHVTPAGAIAPEAV
jgi:hypothetical protein